MIPSMTLTSTHSNIAMTVRAHLLRAMTSGFETTSTTPTSGQTPCVQRCAMRRNPNVLCHAALAAQTRASTECCLEATAVTEGEGGGGGSIGPLGWSPPSKKRLDRQDPPQNLRNTPGLNGEGDRATNGQVWTRHLAPAAPAPRPSSPLQFQCMCRAAAMFAPLCWSLTSLVRVSGGQLAAGSGLYRLLPGLGLGRSSIFVFHVGCRRPSGALAVAGHIRPHTSHATFTRSWRVWGRSVVNQVDCCHQSRLCIWSRRPGGGGGGGGRRAMTSGFEMPGTIPTSCKLTQFDFDLSSQGGGGHTQVKERPPHARPGMHPQQCAAVPVGCMHHTAPLGGHEAMDTQLPHAPVSQATGHSSQMFRCTAAPFMFISLVLDVTNSTRGGGGGLRTGALPQTAPLPPASLQRFRLRAGGTVVGGGGGLPAYWRRATGTPGPGCAPARPR